MERFNIECQNDDCNVDFEYECEPEDAGDGSEHTAECPNCGKKTYFEVAYIATVDSFSLGLVEE